VYLLEGKAESAEMSPSIPALGAIVGEKSDISPILHQDSTIHLLIAITRLIVVAGKLHRDLVCKVSLNLYYSLNTFLILFFVSILFSVML